MSDQGLFGPGSVAWRVVGHPVSLAGGLRSLIVQSLHPLAMAGVAQHSDYRHRALDRLRRTAHYVAATTFGDTATAQAAAERVRRVHRRVRGVDPVTGRAYSADDPDTQLWVHCVEWHSFMAAYRAYGGHLTRAERDRYVAEGVRAAALLGVPAERVPACVADLRDYFASVRGELRASEDARAAIAFVLRPPLTRELLPYQAPLRLMSSAALGLVPRDLRRLAGVDRPAAADALVAAAFRPVAGALTLPGVRDLHGRVLGQGTRRLASRARAASAPAA